MDLRDRVFKYSFEKHSELKDTLLEKLQMQNLNM